MGQLTVLYGLQTDKIILAVDGQVQLMCSIFGIHFGNLKMIWDSY